MADQIDAPAKVMSDEEWSRFQQVAEKQYREMPREKRVPRWQENSVSPTRDATPEEIAALREIGD